MSIFLSQSIVILKSEKKIIFQNFESVYIYFFGTFIEENKSSPPSGVGEKPQFKEIQWRIVSSELLLLFCIVRIG